MKTELPVLLLTLAGACHATDTTAAEAAVREGNPEKAVLLLQDAESSAEVHFWRGRALVDLERFAEALTEFSQVPANATLHRHAGLAAVYCALRTDNAEEFLQRLAKDEQADVAAAANAALQELYIRRKQTANLEQIVHTVAGQGIIIPESKLLLTAEQLRKNGMYTEALELCREAESASSAKVREYSRLIIAEIYYDMERTNPESQAEGKGEETLLKFISSFPESRLLDEAFRRLEYHHAFSNSKYTTQKLEEWSRDVSATYRALLAIAVLQNADLNRYDDAEQGEILTNRAISINPEFLPITVHINNEMMQSLITQGKPKEALEIAERIPQEKWDAKTYFLKALTLPTKDPEATRMYLRCAESAAPHMREIALSNAVFCAFDSGDTDTCRQLLEAEYTENERRAILLTHATLIVRKDAATAAKELQEVLQLNPTTEQRIEAILLLTQIDLEQQQSAEALARLGSFTHAQRTTWSNNHVMRYYGLYLEALELESAAGNAYTSHKDFLLEVLHLTKRHDVKVAVTLKLAKIYSEENKHAEALALLRQLSNTTEDKELRARLLLLAGRESTQQNTLNGIKTGADLYEQASRIDSPYKHKATILRAAVLARINRVDEATQIINRELKRIETERENTPGSTYLSEEYAFALTVLADIHAIPGTKEALLKAIETNEKISFIPGLTTIWHVRAHLQQGIFCARANLSEKALFNFRNILQLLPNDSSKSTPDNIYILCLAGTGAIAAQIKLERWSDAAQTAATIAEHPIAQKAPKRVEQFRAWEKQIRLYHPNGNTKTAP